MKVKDFDEVKTIISFLKSTENKISDLNKAEKIRISVDGYNQQGIVDVGKKFNETLFNRFKSVAIGHLEKDRQTALRKLIKLGVDV